MPEEENLDLEVSFRTEQLPEDLNNLIGKGMDFKRMFSSVAGGLEINEGIERINQSIHDILSTRIGERGFMRAYGSDLYKLVFSPNDNILYDLIRIYIQDAIRRWEKRIVLESVQVIVTPEDIDSHIVNVFIEYSLRNTNIYGSYVYPFVKDPMTLIPFGEGRR